MKDSFDLIIFDLDGTLIEFHHDYLFNQTHQILSAFNHPPVEQKILEHHFSMFDYFAFVQNQQEQFIERFWNAFDWDNFPKAKPLPNTLTMLEQLRVNGFDLAIATARLTPEEQLRDELDHTGFLNFISHVATRRCQTIDWRDKKETITSVCNAHNIAPRRAVMVGDIPADIESAKDVGIGLTVAVKSGGIQDKVLAAKEPDMILDTAADLLNLISHKQT